MSLDYSNPEIQNFLIESYNKENKQRVQWFIEHKETIIQKNHLTDKHKHYIGEQVDKVILEGDILALRNQHTESATNRKRNVLAADTTTLNPFSVKVTEVLVMKPVDTNESNILYTDLEAGGGRKAYLNVRKHKLPEEKYNYPLTSNDFGWEWSKNHVYSKPKYARCASFLRDTTRLSGVHPDPPHYQPPTSFY